MQQRIKTFIAPGEGSREEAIRLAIVNDPRFEPLQIDPNNTVDLFFRLERECWSDSNLHIELKRPADFIQSVLSGHLYDQTLSIRESGYNGCVVILGTLDEIYEAIRESATGRGIKKAEVGHVIATTYSRCKSFRKRSFLNGIPVFHKGDDSGFFDSDDQWKDLLELASDYLTDGDMLGFRQRPANGEREILAASILFHGDGIGPGVLKPVMNEYRLALVPKGEYARQPLDIGGIGPKRAKLIEERIVMHYGH